MATIIANPQLDDIRRPFQRMRLIPAFVISSSLVTPLLLFCFGMFHPSKDAALKAIVIVQAVELLLQIVGFASLFIIPPRDEEQYLVERLKKTNLVSLMGWCFKCALYPSSFQVHLAEFIIGCMIPIVGCWVFLGVPHLFVTKFPRGWEEEAKHFV